MTGIGRTIVRDHTHRIQAAPAAVFPLLCPAREDEWLDGWAERCRMVQTASGVAEAGCVFLTTDPGRLDAVWVTTRHEPASGLVEYVWVWPGEEVVRLTIVVEDDGAGSKVAIRHTAVPLPGADEEALEARWSPDVVDPWMRWWERSLNHYLATGEMLQQH